MAAPPFPGGPQSSGFPPMQRPPAEALQRLNLAGSGPVPPPLPSPGAVPVRPEQGEESVAGEG